VLTGSWRAPGSWRAAGSWRAGQWGRAVVVGGLVGVAALAAGSVPAAWSAGLAVRLPSDATGVVQAVLVAVAGGCAALLLAGVLAVLRPRRRSRHPDVTVVDHQPPPGTGRVALLLALAALAVPAVLLAVAPHLLTPPRATARATRPPATTAAPTPVGRPTRATAGPDRPDNRPGGGSGSVAWWPLAGLLAAAAAGGTALAVARRAGRAAVTPPDIEPSDGGWAPALRAGQAAPTGDAGLPRDAVIRCYTGMISTLSASGLARRGADTPAELLARALDAGTTPTARRLTDLFCQARFSSHPIGPADVAAAATALRQIQAAKTGDPWPQDRSGRPAQASGLTSRDTGRRVEPTEDGDA
jgi:hypothetical protein